jgi:hypothetical protein
VIKLINECYIAKEVLVYVTATAVIGLCTETPVNIFVSSNRHGGDIRCMVEQASGTVLGMGLVYKYWLQRWLAPSSLFSPPCLVFSLTATLNAILVFWPESEVNYHQTVTCHDSIPSIARFHAETIENKNGPN